MKRAQKLWMYALALLVVALLSGCDGGRSPAWERQGVLIGPIPLADGLAWVDGSRERVVIVEAGTGSAGELVPRVASVGIGRRPVAAVPTPDRMRLVVVTRGAEAEREGEVDEEPGLYVVDLVEPERAPRRYEVGSPFDRVAVSADGAVAVAYFSAAGPDAEGLFRNPNELAVVQLGDEPSTGNPVLRTVRSFGAAPVGVVLSPAMTLPGDPSGEMRTFAFVLAPSTVTVLDVGRPTTREVTVRLALDGDPAVVPRELVFAPAAGAAYLRADGARDVLQVLLSYEAPASEDDNDFQPALAELGAGGTPADVAVYDDAAGRRRVLVATPGTHELTVIDADTAEFVSIDVGEAIDRVVLVPAERPRFAMVAAVAARARRVFLVELGELGETLVAPRPRTLELAAPVFDALAVPGPQERVLLVHDDNRTVLGLLDAAAATVAPIEGAGRLDSFDFVPGGQFLVGASRQVARVGFVDLGNLHPEDLRLDVTPQHVFALGSKTVAVDHGTSFGAVTFVRPGSASREGAVVLSGFLLAGLFDEEWQ